MKTNISKAIIKQIALATITAAAFSIAPAQAVNPNFVAGDLVLYFQQFGGTGIPFMIDLGPATTYRDATSNILNITNVVSGASSIATGSLTGATGGSPVGGGYSATWYEDPTVFWGVAAVRSSSAGTSAQVNGDPSRTIYVSAARTDVNTQSTPWSVGTGSATGTSNNILSMVNRLGTVPAAATDRLIEGTGTSFVDNQNPFLGSNPGTAFGLFTGGVEGTFNTGTLGTMGGVAAESALDLYRILATTNPAGTVITDPAAPLGDGTYEGTFVINNTGSVSFIAPVPEPATVSLLGISAIFGLARRRRLRVG